MIKWEYAVIKTHLDQDALNRLGQGGWELIATSGISYFFKRPINFMEIQNELREAWVESIKAVFAELFND